MSINLKKHFSLCSASDMNDICYEPLSTIGVTYFNYIKIYNDDGSRELLTNNSDWIEHFYKNSLYQSVGAIDIEHLLPKGYFLWSELDVNDAAYKQGRESFNIDNGISFVIKKKNVTYLYIFASQRDNYSISNYYVRNIDLFKRFIQYFHDQGLSLIKQAEKNRIYLPEKQIITQDRINQINITNIERENFFKQTEINRYYLLDQEDDIYFTKKQIECAAYIQKGLTAKECAKALNISYRTVEDHINEMKDKIYIISGKKPSKSELINFLRGLDIEHVLLQ